MTTQYIDPKIIFASDAPTQDKPPAFNNYAKGMDETRSNDGRPTIKQLNFIQQQNDFKFLYMHERGACLPFVEGFPYENNAVVFKDGLIQQKNGSSWIIPFMRGSQNLAELTDVAQARSKLDVYSKAEVDEKKTTEAEAILGVNDSNFVTPKSLLATIKALTLNAKMSQRNVTSQRLLNTTYTNPSESIRIVLVGFMLPQGSNVDVRVDGELQGLATNLTTQTINDYVSVVAFVFPLQTYKFNVVAGSPTIQFCTEISL